MGALTISTELATRELSVALSEDPRQEHVPLDLESAASSLWLADPEPVPTPPTPSSTHSPPQTTGTPAPTPTASVVRTSVSLGQAVTV